MIQEPTVGRMVHYNGMMLRDEEQVPNSFAAIVTTVHGDGCVDLATFSQTGIEFMIGVHYSQDCFGWSWPPFVPSN